MKLLKGAKKGKNLSGIIGATAEQRALEFLLKQGLSLKEQNYRSRVGEIDLVMRDGKELVFVEVRMRSRKNYGSAAETIDFNKLRKLRNTIAIYVQKNYRGVTVPEHRLDVVAIDGEKLEWIRNVC